MVRVKNQPHNESTVQPTDGIRALLVVWSMCYKEKRELKNADPPKTQERLELQGADSRENGNGEVLFKSVYPSSHRSSEAQLLVGGTATSKPGSI